MKILTIIPLVEMPWAGYKDSFMVTVTTSVVEAVPIYTSAAHSS
jgi:hypothetical protein